MPSCGEVWFAEFRGIDEFFGEYLDTPVAHPGARFVSSTRRYFTEPGYGSIFAVWGLVNRHGLTVSAQPHLVGVVEKALWGIEPAEGRLDGSAIDGMRRAVEEVGLPGGTYGVSEGLVFALATEPRAAARAASVRSVQVSEIPAISAKLAPWGWNESHRYAMAEGTLFVAWQGEEPVSIAGTMPIGHHRERVGDVGNVETRAEYRRRGYGAAVVAACAGRVVESGRTAVYQCGVGNTASVRTAFAAGFAPYGWQFRISRDNA